MENDIIETVLTEVLEEQKKVINWPKRMVRC